VTRPASRKSPVHPVPTPTAQHLASSGIREILDLAVPLGDAVARLELGQPGFRTPAHIAEAAAVTVFDDGGYTQSSGTLALRTAIAESLGRRYGTVPAIERIIVTQGGAQGITASYEAIVGPGDEVILPDPAWPNYETLAHLRGATPVHYPLRIENDYVPDPREIASLITEKTRLIVLNSPGNPTGAVAPREVIREIVETAAARGIMVLSDEVYDELIFDGEPANANEFAPDSVISVFSFSKTYAMTGWRVGYLLIPAWLSSTLGHIQESSISCVSSVSQSAALAALTGPQTPVDDMRAAYRERRDQVVGLLAAAGIAVRPPDGAFYLMVPLADGVDSRSAALDLVRHGVSVAPGTAFGTEAASQVRISLASDEATTALGLDRFIRWYESTAGGTTMGGQQ